MLLRLATHIVASELSRSAAVSGVLRVSFTALLLANAAILGRLLGPTGFGIYSFVLALIGFAALPLNFGLSTLLLRDVSALAARRQWTELTALVRFALLVILIYGVAAAIVVATGLQLVGIADTTLLATVAVGLAMLPFHAAGETLGAVLRALGRVLTGQIPDQVLKQALLLVLLGTAAAAFGTQWLTPSRAMSLLLLASLTGVSAAALLLAHSRPRHAWRDAAPLPFAAGLQRWFPLAALGLVQGANAHADVLLLGLLADSEAVGIYRIAAQCSLLVTFSVMVLGPIVGPQIARRHAEGDKAALQRVVTWTARCALATACPVFAVLVGFGPFVLGLFGRGYEAGATALAILSVGQLVNASTGVVGLALNMTGHEKDTMKAIGMAAASTCIANLVLVPPFGIVGAAIATAGSTILWNVVLLQRLRARTGVLSFAFPLPMRAAL